MTSRRRLITRGLAAAAGASGLVVADRFATRYGLIPPDGGGVYGAGATLTYAAQRLLMSAGHSMAREFDRSQISTAFPINGDLPRNDAYQSLLTKKFATWQLTVDGMVARPARFSLDQLMRMQATTQITSQACEEGWSAIAEWTGVRLAEVLNTVGVLPAARYVVFFPFDVNWDSVDMDDAWHPQTLLAWGMNGREIPTEHGAPLRLRVPRQLGYKSVKYLSRITVTDSLKSIRNGLGSISPEIGYSWYAGI
jgi:DMSO/TMAO reductase YedYZ molybdopterin-dependent catalytic subunit